ncbi:MAG: UPF0175 family protein [Candidatus Diapherotrites archaeon]|nr:UPF0175 family protein [Candidatus Diapherotrites archaeon]
MNLSKEKLKKAITLYSAGSIGAAKAAELAGISLWEMLDELKFRNVPNQLTKEDYSEGLMNLKKVWK